ncbi:MAG: hypothetical protein AAF648_15160, partial [Pseudomonadota bacterium]
REHIWELVHYRATEASGRRRQVISTLETPTFSNGLVLSSGALVRPPRAVEPRLGAGLSAAYP